MSETMRALTVTPGTKDSLQVEEFAVPEPGQGELLVEGVALGVCGTDHELNGGHYGWAPEGHERLIIGHESLGRVLSAPEGSGFAEGDVIAGVVRRPDPVPCGACDHGEFDMCRNGQYRERGIKEIDGFGSERWVIPVDYAVKLDPSLGQVGVLMEPTSVVAKAWDQVHRIGRRAWFEPKTVLVSGAGPIGLLAALLGQQQGLQVHVLDRMVDGLKPELVQRLGGQYHHDGMAKALQDVDPDVVIETTGVGEIIADLMRDGKPYAVVCLVGMHDPQQGTEVDLASAGKGIVLDNAAVFGSVNANVHHWEQAAQALAQADKEWLSSLITRVVPLSQAQEAFQRQDGDVKVVIDLQK